MIFGKNIKQSIIIILSCSTKKGWKIWFFDEYVVSLQINKYAYANKTFRIGRTNAGDRQNKRLLSAEIIHSYKPAWTRENTNT